MDIVMAFILMQQMSLPGAPATRPSNAIPVRTVPHLACCSKATKEPDTSGAAAEKSPATTLAGFAARAEV
jgi:hypothetical protein